MTLLPWGKNSDADYGRKIPYTRLGFFHYGIVSPVFWNLKEAYHAISATLFHIGLENFLYNYQ